MILVLILVILIAPLALLKYLGNRVMRPVEIEVSGLSLEEVIDIGTRASHSWARRLLGRPAARHTVDGGAEWHIRSGAGVMGVRVTPSPDGYRVVAQALTMRIAQHEGWINLDTDWGRAKLLTNWLFALLGIPHNPRKLLRQRGRVLRALPRASTVAALPPVPTTSQP